jgi:hypothetical protein
VVGSAICLWMTFHDLAQCRGELTEPGIDLRGVDGSEAEHEPARGRSLYGVLRDRSHFNPVSRGGGDSSAIVDLGWLARAVRNGLR